MAIHSQTMPGIYSGRGKSTVLSTRRICETIRYNRCHKSPSSHSVAVCSSNITNRRQVADSRAPRVELRHDILRSNPQDGEAPYCDHSRMQSF